MVKIQVSVVLLVGENGEDPCCFTCKVLVGEKSEDSCCFICLFCR